MTPAQINKARAMMARAGFEEQDKKTCVKNITNQRTDSLKAMNYAETQELFKYLTALTGQKEDPRDAMRRKMISIAHEMDMHKPNSSRIDEEQINKWLHGKGGFGKDFRDLTYDELTRAVTAFEKVLVGYLKRV